MTEYQRREGGTDKAYEVRNGLRRLVVGDKCVGGEGERVKSRSQSLLGMYGTNFEMRSIQRPRPPALQVPGFLMSQWAGMLLANP